MKGRYRSRVLSELPAKLGCGTCGPDTWNLPTQYVWLLEAGLSNVVVVLDFEQNNCIQASRCRKKRENTAVVFAVDGPRVGGR